MLEGPDLKCHNSMQNSPQPHAKVLEANISSTQMCGVCHGHELMQLTKSECSQIKFECMLAIVDNLSELLFLFLSR